MSAAKKAKARRDVILGAWGVKYPYKPKSMNYKKRLQTYGKVTDTMKLSISAWKELHSLLDNPPPPNNKLKTLFARYNKGGIYEHTTKL